MSATTGEGEPSLGRSSVIMAAGTMSSRVLGMIKAVLTTAIVGSGLAGATFQVANTLPNNFFLIIAGGVLGAVLVPQIVRATKHEDGGEEFVNRLLTVALVVMAVATLAATAAAPWLIRLYSQGWSADDIALGTVFAYICLPQIFFYGLYTLLGQVLNARGRFGAYMWAPALANVVTIGFLLAFYLRGLPRGGDVRAWSPEMIWLLAGGTTLGIVAQALVLLLPLRRMGFRYRPVWGLRGVGLRSASTVALWTFAAVALSQVGYIVTSKVLTQADARATAEGVQGTGLVPYGNAFLLFMLPHSLVTVSLVTALFTRISRSASDGRIRAVVSDLGHGLRACGVLLVPMTVGGMMLAPLATRAMFFGNPVTATDAFAKVLIAMLAGLVPYGWLYLVQRVFYAYEDAKTPFRLQVVVTVLATVVNLASLLLPPEWTGVGVGVGQTVSNLAAALLGLRLLRARIGPLRLEPTLQQHARLLLASLGSAALSVLLYLGVHALLGSSRPATALTLVVVGGFFLAVSLLGASRLGVLEVAEFLAPVLRRVRRSKG